MQPMVKKMHPRLNLRRSSIATLVTGRLIGDDGDVYSVSDVGGAGSCDIAPILHPKDKRFMRRTHAGCLLVDFDTAANHTDELPCAVIAVENIYLAFLKLATFITAKISLPDVVMGQDCVIGPNVTLLPGTRLGDRVRIDAGAVIGRSGFVYAPDGATNLRVPSLYGVVVGDDADIGANTCVDAGLLRDTCIGARTKIDNLVLIAHDVRVGEDCVIAGQSGIAGHSVIGNRCVIAGQVGIVDHVNVGDDVTVLAKSSVMRDVKSGLTVAGNPSVEHAQFLKNYKRAMLNAT